MEYKVPMTFEATEIGISPLIHGHFIEFIENCMNGGVYDPGSAASDERGVRQDVLALAKGLSPTLVVILYLHYLIYQNGIQIMLQI